jgi:hypothetical protein
MLLKNSKLKIVEKNQPVDLIKAKTAFTAGLVFFFSTINAQKMQAFKEHCGVFFESMAHLYKVKQVELDFYHFKPVHSVASTGAQYCHIEAALAAITDSVTFYLEEIDSSKFKKEQTELFGIIIVNCEAAL